MKWLKVVACFAMVDGFNGASECAEIGSNSSDGSAGGGGRHQSCDSLAMVVAVEERDIAV